MSTPDRRRAERIDVGMPAQVYGEMGFLDARVCDLSRTGLRMRMRVADLELEPTEDIAVAAEAVGRALAPQFALDLDYRKLGPLLQRSVHLTRICLPPDAPMFVEIGCAFDEPLDEAIEGILHVELPPLKDDVPAWTPSEDAGEPLRGTATLRPRDALREEEPAALTVQVGPPPPPRSTPARERVPAPPAKPPVRHRYRALVTGTARGAPPTSFCHTDLVTAVGVRVCVPRPPEGATTIKAMDAMIRSHGAHVDVRILDERQDVWSGSARISGVELPSSRLDVMLVTLTYDRPLSMAAMRRLGLLAA